MDIHVIDAEDIVIEDVVILSKDHIVPADCRIVRISAIPVTC